MSTTLPTFEIPPAIADSLLVSGDITRLREAVIAQEISVSGGSVDTIGITQVVNALPESEVRMLALENLSMNNAPATKPRAAYRIDRDGQYLATEKGIVESKSLENTGMERGI